MLTRIAGIPCQVELTYFDPGEPPFLLGHPDNWEPGVPPEVRFDVLDRRGRPAPWLEKKMSDDEHSRIVDLLIKNERGH